MPGYGAAAIRWKKLLAGASWIFIYFNSQLLCGTHPNLSLPAAWELDVATQFVLVGLPTPSSSNCIKRRYGSPLLLCEDGLLGLDPGVDS